VNKLFYEKYLVKQPGRFSEIVTSIEEGTGTVPGSAAGKE
jgi:hypothetical protein